MSSAFDRWEADGAVVFTVGEPFSSDNFGDLPAMLESEDGSRIVLDLLPLPRFYQFSDRDHDNLMGAFMSVWNRGALLLIVADPWPQRAQLDGWVQLTPFFVYKRVEDAIRSFDAFFTRGSPWRT